MANWAKGSIIRKPADKRCQGALIPANKNTCQSLVLSVLFKGLPNFAKTVFAMSTMNISLPESLKTFVDEQVNQRGYGTSSEYLRELIRKDQDRQTLRNLLIDGLNSKPTQAVDSGYFDQLRAKVNNHQK